MKNKRYGKTSSGILNQKKHFFIENDKNIEKQKEISLIYKSQPRRINCKNCDKKLTSEIDFIKNEIGYTLCQYCTHLNGIYDDTDDFCAAVYMEDSGKNYAENYKSSDINSYNYRVSSIYIPKAEFLYTSLLENNINPNNFKYLDFGSGSGYFVSALRKIGIDNSFGTEVSKSQVDFGNMMIGDNVLEIHDFNETSEVLKNTKMEVVSMIGVLEHLRYPRSILYDLKNNKNVKYIFLSVPTFSLSSYLEIIFPDVFHRQLGGGHTHLYTEKSIHYLCKDFGFEIITEWWFGTDMVDLFRNISVTLEKMQCSTKVRDIYSKDFLSVLDSMQLELDKKQMSSEVHLLLKKVDE